MRCPGPLGSCSPVRPLGVLLCVRGVLGHLVPVHRCACSLFCFVCPVSWDTWLLFTGVPARCVVSCVRCLGPLGSCSPVCQAVVSPPFVALGARACAVSWPSWRLFTGVCSVRCACAVGVCVPLPPPLICFFFLLFFLKSKKRGARIQCRHRHGLGAFWAGPGVAPRGGGLLGNGVRWRSCCVARRAPGVLWVPPVLMRRRLWGGGGGCVCGVGL